MKKIVIICMLILIVGCADKNNMVTEPVPVKQVVTTSIFNEPAVSFIESDIKNLTFANPKQSLEKINEHVVKAEQEGEDLAPLLALRGLVQSQLGSKDMAFDDMTEAVQLRPNAELYALRALVLWRGGKMRGAMRDAEYAMTKEKGLALGEMVQGLVLLEENEMSKACAALKSACNAGQCYGLEYANKQGQCN